MNSNQELEQLIRSTPLDQLNPDQALRVLLYILSTEKKSEIKPEYLDLSVRCRYFSKSIIMMNEGVVSDKICPIIFFLLNSTSELSDDFSYFLLFCFANLNNSKTRFDFSDISNHVSSFSQNNIQIASILLTSYLYLNPNYDLKQLENSDLSKDYQKPLKIIINSFKDNNSIPPYEYLKNYFEEMIKEFEKTTYPKLSEAISTFKSEEVINRINELTNSLLVTAKNMPKNLKASTIDEYKNKFQKNVQELEDFMKAKLLSSSRDVRLSTTKAKSISDEIDRLPSELNNVKEIVIDQFLANPNEETVNKIMEEVKSNCFKFSTQPEAKLDFTSSTPTFLFLTNSIALIKLHTISQSNGDETNLNKALSKLKELGNTIENIVERLKTDILNYRNIIVETINLSQSLNDKNDKTYRSVHSACDALLLWLHLSECASLDGIIREESVLYAEKSSFYPDFAKNIFTKVIKKATKEKVKSNKELRDSLYQTVSLRYASFIRNLKLVPGMRKDALYKDFVPTEKWPWPKIQGTGMMSFSQDPDYVREMLKLRSQIYSLADEYAVSLSVPLCENCKKAVACVVCPKCKKLVLCNACKDKLKKCPLDGCDHVFE